MNSEFQNEITNNIPKTVKLNIRQTLQNGRDLTGLKSPTVPVKIQSFTS